MFKRTLLASAAVAAIAFTGSGASASSIDLGFIMDESGSVNESPYLAAMEALAAALQTHIPVDGSGDTYTISVVSFSSDARVIIGATEINSQADLDLVTNAIRNDDFNGGFTNYAAALDLMGTQFNTLGDSSMINMMTDGRPNEPGTNANAEAQAILSSQALDSAGWDSLSFESVGNTSGNNLLANLGFGPGVAPNDGTNLPIFTDVGDVTDPLNSPFVLDLASFDEYNAVIGTKIQKIVDPGPTPVPVPAALPLLLAGMGALGFAGRRRRKEA